MKNNFKKVISLLLTVLMVLGTMSTILPFAVSAEEVTYPYTLKKNETAVAPNGVTYRFDVADGHTDSWARLNADGSWEINIRNGDMLWFPDVEMADSSEIYAEVTSMSTVNHFPGLAYGVVSSTDSAYTGTNVAVIRTNSGNVRLRATGATSDALNNDKGGVTVNNFEVTVNDAWTSIANPTNGNWDAGKTIYHKIYQTADKVVTEFGAPGKGAFGTPESQTSYAKGMEGMYGFDGGSVGYTMVWSEGNYYQFRIEDITITNCNVGGEAKDTYSIKGESSLPEVPEGTVYLEKNKTATYKGITYRFDTNKENDDNSWVRVNADGSWEISIRNGDMLWFPNIELTDSSEIYAEVTNTMNQPNNYFTGFAYGVTSSTDSTWTNTNVAVLKTYQNSKARFRAANAERSSLINVSGGDYGNGGDTRAFDSSFISDVWDSATAGDNGNWGPGKTVYYKLSQIGSDVVLEYGAPGVGAFVDATNTTYTASELNAVAGGSVGYTNVWQSNDDAHVQLRIEDITITNCKVGGEAKDTYSIKEESSLPEAPEGTVYLKKNKTATYKGITYRFDTNKENDDNSWVRVNADGSWEISIRNGDMLWFPDIELTDSSEIYAEVTNTMNQPNNYFTGFAYGVTSSTDSTWTNTNVAVLKTFQNSKARFRAANAERSSLINVSDEDYGNGGDTRAFDSSFISDVWNSATAGDNGNWGPGKTVYYKLSQIGSDVVLEYGAPGVGAFVDATNTTYTASELNAVAGGSVGYTSVWQSNDDAHVQLRIEDITITNCKVGGVDKAVYSVNSNSYDVAEEKISLSLNGTIGLNFGFNAGVLLPTGATVVATMSGKVVAEQAVVDGANVVTAPVNAKEMNDDVNIAIMVNGEVYDKHSYTVSVKEYVDKLMADDDFNEWDELMVAMLDYGAAAQMLFDYKTDDLVADISDGIDYDFSKVEDITFDGKKEDVLDGLYMNLSLEANTVMNLYFKPADGVTLAVTVNDKAIELVDNGDGYYVATIEGVAADKLMEGVFVTVNGKLAFKVTALNWAKIASQDTDEDVLTLAEALAVYAEAASSKK